jgi:hypothetical protein
MVVVMVVLTRSFRFSRPRLAGTAFRAGALTATLPPIRAGQLVEQDCHVTPGELSNRLLDSSRPHVLA